MTVFDELRAARDEAISTGAIYTDVVHARVVKILADAGINTTPAQADAIQLLAGYPLGPLAAAVEFIIGGRRP